MHQLGPNIHWLQLTTTVRSMDGVTAMAGGSRQAIGAAIRAAAGQKMACIEASARAREVRSKLPALHRYVTCNMLTTYSYNIQRAVAGS